MKLFINYRNNGCRHSADKQYGDWSEQNNYNEISASNKPEYSYETFNIDFIPKDKVYLVKGVYTTGDSFGSSTGNVEYIDVFENEIDAIQLQEKIELFYEFTTKDWYGYNPKQKADKIRNYKYLLKDYLKAIGDAFRPWDFEYKGKPYYFPWGGYFETLTYMEVVELDYKEVF